MCRSTHAVTIFPNEFISFPVGPKFDNEHVAMDPREMSAVVQTYNWPRAQILSVIDHELRLVNDTQHPIYIPKHEQLCNIRSTQIIDSSLCQSKPSVLVTPTIRSVQTTSSKEVQIDPHKQLPPKWIQAFQSINIKHDNVFEPTIGRYNGYSGKLKARVLFGSTVPPSKKLHAPTYSKENLHLLQEMFDKLESQKVFGRPLKITESKLNM